MTFPPLSCHYCGRQQENFPVIQVFFLQRCSDIEILRTDLQVFPALRAFFLWQGSTIRSIEPGSFDQLPYLRHITFDTFDTSKPLPQTALDQLRLLHCDPQYKWLRVFLRERPYLIAPKAEGEIFDVGGFVNSAYLKKDIFTPVNCSLESLVGGALFRNFSSLDERYTGKWMQSSSVYVNACICVEICQPFPAQMGFIPPILEHFEHQINKYQTYLTSKWSNLSEYQTVQSINYFQ